MKSTRTKLQYTLRSVFLVTLVVALLCALVAPWIRRLKFDDQMRLGVYVAGSMLVATLFLCGLCYCRRWAERESGALLLLTGIRHRMWYHVGVIAFLAIMLLSWIGRLPDVFRSDASSLWSFLLGQPIMSIYLLVGYVVLVLWWKLDPTAIEARENGLIQAGTRFTPWHKIESHRWGGPSPSHLTLQLHQVVLNLKVEPRDKEKLDVILKEKVGRPPGSEST